MRAERYFSLGASLMGGIMLIEGLYIASILFVLVAIFGMEGLLFE